MITILNILAVIPMVLYPVLLATSIMTFSMPTTDNPVKKMFLGFAMLLFPVLIVVGIVLSRKYNSIIWAIIACIPLIILMLLLIKNKFSAGNKHSRLYNKQILKTVDQNNLQENIK